jgi:hypothetical protein
VAATKARVAELSAGEVAAARRAHALVLAYDAALSKVYFLQAQVLAAEGTAASLRAIHRSTTALLQREALLFYVGAVPNEAPSGGAAMAGEFVSEADQATFERLAVGNVSRTLALFQQEETGIERALASYRRALRAELAAARALSSSRLHALAQAAALQKMLERSRAVLAAEAVKHRAGAGPPVGHGIVAAIATELRAASAMAQGMGHFTPASARTPLLRSARPVVNAAKKTGPTTQPQATSPASATTTASGTPSTARRMPNPPVPAGSAGDSSRTAPAEVLARTTLSTTLRRATATFSAKTTSSLPTTTSRAKTATASPTTAPRVTTTTLAPATTTTLVATTTSTLATTTTPPTTTPAVTAPATTSEPPTTAERPTAAATTTSNASSSSGEPSPAGTSGPTTSSSSSTTSASSAGTHPPPAGGVWLELRECESGDNYQADTGNGFYGAYQFAWSTWTALGYSGRPDQAPYWVQDAAAQKLEAMEGWSPWPACSVALGL